VDLNTNAYRIVSALTDETKEKQSDLWLLGMLVGTEDRRERQRCQKKSAERSPLRPARPEGRNVPDSGPLADTFVRHRERRLP
jgi:hypothetical protein